MGDGTDPLASPKPPTETPMAQLVETLWHRVAEGKIKQLQKFIKEHANHSRFDRMMTNLNDEFDEDGGNLIIHCVRHGFPKSSFGRDHVACLALLAQQDIDINAVDKAKLSALSWAVKLKHTGQVAKLLELGAIVDHVDQEGDTPFHSAIHFGHKDIVAMFMEYNIKLVDLRDIKGVPPLVIAVKYGHVEVCRMLLEKGADVNAPEQNTKRTAVYHAIRNGNMDMLDMLLKYSPKVSDTVDCEGRSILYLVCASSDIRFFHKIKTLCPKFSKKIMDSPADEGKTPVIVACEHGNSEQLKYLLDEGATVTAVDEEGRTALHHCADNLETQCAEMLLEKDLSILELKDERGLSALALAVMVGNTNLIRLLLDKGADICTENDEGLRLAHWAAVTSNLKVLDVLIQHNTDLSTPDKHHAYPIHYAAQMGGATNYTVEPKIAEKVLRKLIDSHVKLDVEDNDKRQPLLWAACAGRPESVKLLLKASVDINSRDKDQLTALHCAASRGHRDVIEVLRKGGANSNLRDVNGCTPLFYAITLAPNTDCSKSLIAAKADVNHIDNRGRNPAHCAAIKGCLTSMKMLEKEKADLWHQNNKGDYPIHEAAQKGHIEVVKHLLRVRNDKETVNLSNHVGKTLLHIAATTNNISLCRLLLNHECEKNSVMTHKGKKFTAYDLAVIKKYTEIADILKSKGALPASDLTNIDKQADTKPAETPKEQVKPDPKSPEKEKEKEKLRRGSKGSPIKPNQSSPTKQNQASPTKGKNTPRKRVESPNKAKTAAGVAAVAAVKKTEDKSKEKEEKVKKEDTVKAKKEEDSVSRQSNKSESVDAKNRASPTKSDKSVGKDYKTDAAQTDIVTPDKDSDAASKDGKLKKRPSSDSVLEKEDGILSSPRSLSPETRNAETQKNAVEQIDRSTSTMGSAIGKKKAAPEKGKNAEKEAADYDADQSSQERSPTRKSMKSRVGFEKSDADDSGVETDHGRSRSRRNMRIPRGSRNHLEHVRDTVRVYNSKRNQSRSIQQLKRAQIHTGPMHDIVMFSKMMDNYRRGFGPDDEDMDLRQFANFDGYLNDQLRFVSHLYNDESKSPREIQETAKEQHMRLETEANNRKVDSENKSAQILEEEEKERMRNSNMDKEIDNLALKTAEMFDSVKTTAERDLDSAKTKNSRMREEMVKSREERLRETTDPHEREILQRQMLEDEMAEQQQEVEQSRKEKFKNWHRRKDEEMRRRLLQAYRPYFPNDVFHSKSVCISGGRIKSATRLGVDSSQIQPKPRPKHSSPRPHSHKSDNSSSMAQYRVKEDKNQVQMTPYGLRRIRSQERPTYEDVEDELAEAIFFNPGRSRSAACPRSADAAANWSRKYNGSIRPRTGLVFVEPRVYDDLMREERDAKQRISSRVHSHIPNGDIHHSHTNMNDTTSDSLIS